MDAANRMRQYQQQAIASSSPAQLVLKLYDLGIQCCRRDDRSKLRAVLAELIGSLNFEEGGDIANRLYSLYEYCLNESVGGDLEIVGEVLNGLRDAWKEGVVSRQAA
jgi:flagellar protein FliS